MISLSEDQKICLINGKGMWHINDCNGKFPIVMMTDGPHGVRKQETDKVGQNDDSKIATCFPTESAVACSWDTEIVAKMANAIRRCTKL